MKLTNNPVCLFGTKRCSQIGEQTKAILLFTYSKYVDLKHTCNTCILGKTWCGILRLYGTSKKPKNCIFSIGYSLWLLEGDDDTPTLYSFQSFPVASAINKRQWKYGSEPWSWTGFHSAQGNVGSVVCQPQLTSLLQKTKTTKNIKHQLEESRSVAVSSSGQRSPHFCQVLLKHEKHGQHN